jgi:hypothetical protein
VAGIVCWYTSMVRRAVGTKGFRLGTCGGSEPGIWMQMGPA